MSLPTGTVTFLFTDIEASTRLLQLLGDRYPDVLETHRRLLRAAIEQAGGHEFETQGDGLFVAFPNAKNALTAAVAAQKALHEQSWPKGASVRVRMGLHTGQPIVTDSGYVRYRLLETIRQYARDRLREAGEADIARRRHRDFFVELAARAESESTGSNESQWAGTLKREHDNLRAALGWSLESGDPETALRLAGMLGWFWSEREYLAEGRKWLQTALAEANEVAATLRAKALQRAGWLARLQGDFGGARRLLEESVSGPLRTGSRGVATGRRAGD